MPKFINRDLHKTQIAAKAAPLFSKHGYNALGMREIAQKLGLSKSALYHYFASKQALFDAATQYALSVNMAQMSKGLRTEATQSQKLHQLHKNMLEIEPKFEGELTLVLDYIKQKSQEQVKNDVNMQLANKAFENIVAKFVGKDDAYTVTCLYYGAFLQRLFDGQTSDMDQIQHWLETKLNTGKTK